MKQLIFLLSFLPALSVLAQQPEQQHSFATDPHPLDYYVQQAELWQKELQKDSLSENNWYNYYRACRNAHGTADWQSDFVELSPALKTGNEILAQMEQKIPGTFMVNYLTYLNQGIGTDNGDKLLEAYRMNPDFEGIDASVVTYAVSAMDFELRKEANRAWYPKNYLSSQLMNYAYNVLMSVKPDAILLTQTDNDSYPVWMLQDVFDIRTDVAVINIDFLLIKEYRDKLLAQLGIPPLDFEKIELDDYHENWTTIVEHILRNYSGDRPLYTGLTLFNHLYKTFENDLYISGLALLYSREEQNLNALNRKLVEDTFRLDYLKYHFTVDGNQLNVDYQNLNYIRCFRELYQEYMAEGKNEEAEELRDLALALASRINDPELEEQVALQFQ